MIHSICQKLTYSENCDCILALGNETSRDAKCIIKDVVKCGKLAKKYTYIAKQTTRIWMIMGSYSYSLVRLRKSCIKNWIKRPLTKISTFNNEIERMSFRESINTYCENNPTS